jgi:hypothetical protein
MDTLAFGYEIPVITALSGLAPVGNSICPAHLLFNLFEVVVLIVVILKSKKQKRDKKT